jgi:hypothetical protein
MQAGTGLSCSQAAARGKKWGGGGGGLNTSGRNDERQGIASLYGKVVQLSSHSNDEFKRGRHARLCQRNQSSSSAARRMGCSVGRVAKLRSIRAYDRGSGVMGAAVGHWDFCHAHTKHKTNYNDKVV